MTITQFGRVEMDLNRVPIPASAKDSAEPSFQERLDRVAGTGDRESEAKPRQRRTEGPSTPAPETVEGRPAEEAIAPEAVEPTREPRPQPLPFRADRPADSAPADNVPFDRAVASTQDRAQPGAGLPSELTRPTLKDGVSNPAATATPIAPAAARTAANQPVRSVQAEVRAPAEGARLPTSRTSAARSQAGYRTINKATVQMAEAARDSVFRQVAMRINGEGGEMRVFLDPPELGQLDLHMVVEKGGTVHLSLIAERPELALVLEKHMAELKQALQVQGLSIGNTEVRAREENAPNRGRADTDSSGDPDKEQDEDALPLQRAGYITAEGLDFWV